MTVINTNVKSLVAQNSLSVNSRDQDKSMKQLSTGLRINTSSDDAAGMAIASRMTGQIKGLDQAVRNANDGISMLQTADAALSTVSNMMQRQHELAVQYNNATYSSDDKSALQDEFDSLNEEITRITESTQWAGQPLFATSDDDRVIQVSDVTELDTTPGMANQIGIDLTIADEVTGGLIDDEDTTTAALKAVNDLRSGIGATVNRLTYAADNAASISTNMSASRSRIQDTDYAKASSELARTQIISQASTAMLAQANQSSQSVLALLK